MQQSSIRLCSPNVFELVIDTCMDVNRGEVSIICDSSKLELSRDMHIPHKPSICNLLRRDRPAMSMLTISGMVDGCDYDGQKRCYLWHLWTVPNDLKYIQASFFCWFWLIGYAYELLRHLMSRSGDYCGWWRQQTDYFTAAHAHGVIILPMWHMQHMQFSNMHQAQWLVQGVTQGAPRSSGVALQTRYIHS